MLIQFFCGCLTILLLFCQLDGYQSIMNFYIQEFSQANGMRGMLKMRVVWREKSDAFNFLADWSWYLMDVRASHANELLVCRFEADPVLTS
ncbi:hypothetical protein NPIL_561221 [Nephila pilipes]|uniref:Uncharacterized protein n=1 Tax=Nephila pilipes TaxID=299642 RepID=A0A8X6PY63_NEPPI|nr:hypothetical protein NPIL_561221 [Nephila pilipes]